ncbi:cyclic nucleotide-gated ion channel 1-like isoform X2 [Arachis hypogaea]|uniref:cyclic nucleotide-gated ion channel 1-like isoform X2 n=1 Tax=Arachis hypogaea TaxID=3818 RepID=UPI0034E81B2E
MTEKKFVRFEDWRSDSSTSIIEKYDLSTDGFFKRKVIKKPGATPTNNKSDGKESTNKKCCTKIKVLDPQGPLLQKWNKIFVIICVMAISVDPLFLYIPVINEEKKCLSLDKRLEIVACALRTFFDLFYIIRILFQFRTGFIAPSSRVFGRGELIHDTKAIVIRYLCSDFIIDILSIIPLPQMYILAILPIPSSTFPYKVKNMLKFTILAQYVPRLLRLYLLFKEVTSTCGILTETAWAGAAYNLFLYMLASHVVGAFWYLFSIEAEVRCWHKVVKFHNYSRSSTDFPQKFFFCFWWGFRNLSSLGQNLLCSTYIGENIFAILIAIFGLVLFSSLIGNMQKYLQSTTVRVEEMRIKRRDAERWMSHRMLPDCIRERIRRYLQYKWQQNRGVEEEALIRNLPKDLRRDIRRHLCLKLLTRVPMFENMNKQLLDAMCDRLKPVLYTEKSYIVCEGDPVDEMLFIMRGNLRTATTNGGRTGFFNSSELRAGDFCGEELLTWALDPNCTPSLPISTRTVETISEVEAFALMADDLKFVASQFRRVINSKQLQHTFRFYSLQWKTWAACFIQAAWRRYRKKKAERVLREAEEVQSFGMEDGYSNNSSSSSPSFVATVYAQKFAANALRPIRSGKRTNKVPPPTQRLLPLLPQKPAEPDFTSQKH